MDGRLIEDAESRDRRFVFRNRAHAGARLASVIRESLEGDEIVLAIPSGGVPVGLEIAKVCSLPMDLLVVRKLQVPGNPEAGFGALDPDGVRVLNRALCARLGLDEETVKAQTEKTLWVIRYRDAAFRGGKPFPELYGKTAVIVDDGLASGYTMRAALGFVRRSNARKVMVAVPTGCEETVQALLGEVDVLVCLNVRRGRPFAVAEAYINWYDVSDEEVVRLMESLRDEES